MEKKKETMNNISLHRKWPKWRGQWRVNYCWTRKANGWLIEFGANPLPGNRPPSPSRPHPSRRSIGCRPDPMDTVTRDYLHTSPLLHNPFSHVRISVSLAFCGAGFSRVPLKKSIRAFINDAGLLTQRKWTNKILINWSRLIGISGTGFRVSLMRVDSIRDQFIILALLSHTDKVTRPRTRPTRTSPHIAITSPPSFPYSFAMSRSNSIASDQSTEITALHSQHINSSHA